MFFSVRAVGLCRFGEAWAALRAENLLDPPPFPACTWSSTFGDPRWIAQATAVFIPPLDEIVHKIRPGYGEI